MGTVRMSAANMGAAKKHILLFGGTAEGRELADELVSRGYDVLVCVATSAGTRQYPVDRPHLDVHEGRLDAAEMAALADERFAFIIDATHPFAVEVSANIREAAKQVHLPYYRVIRPRVDFSGCLSAESVADACRMIPDDGDNVLAATGNKEIADYTVIADYRNRVFARVLPDEASVQSCRDVGFADDHIIAERGPFSVDENIAVIRAHDIRYLVTKESGAVGGFPEKIEAARTCGCAMIVVCRPRSEEGFLPEDVLASVGWAHAESGAGQDDRGEESGSWRS